VVEEAELIENSNDGIWEENQQSDLSDLTFYLMSNYCLIICGAAIYVI